MLYHSGREFTSEDVKFNVLRGRDPKIAGGAWVTQSTWGWLISNRCLARTHRRRQWARDYVRLKADPHYQAVEHPTDGRYFLFGVNVLNPPLNNKLVRQALNWSLDRDRIVGTALLGVGTTKTLPWPATSPAYDAAKDHAYTYDLDKARSLLGGAQFAMDCVLQSGNAELATAAQVNNRKYNGIYASTDSRTALNEAYAERAGSTCRARTSNASVGGRG